MKRENIIGVATVAIVIIALSPIRRMIKGILQKACKAPLSPAVGSSEPNTCSARQQPEAGRSPPVPEPSSERCNSPPNARNIIPARVVSYSPGASTVVHQSTGTSSGQRADQSGNSRGSGSERGQERSQDGGRGRGRAREHGRRQSRGNAPRNVTCARCGTSGHYSETCEQPFGPVEQSWPPRLITVALQMRREAGEPVVWHI